MSITRLLEENIKKLDRPLKSEEALIEILKKRLTKKEFKVLMLIVDSVSKEEQLQKLSLDEKRYEEVRTKAFKKVNFNDLKEELLEEKED